LYDGSLKIDEYCRLVPHEGNENRIKVVDLARAVSIIAVLANHFFSIQFAPQTIHSNPIFRFIDQGVFRFAISGAYGVSMFFVLSGFLISRMTAARNDDLYRVNVRQFYIRRVGRIVPLLLLILSMVLLVVLCCSTLPPEAAQEQMPLQTVFTPTTSNFDPLFFLSFFTLSLNWLFIFSGRSYGLQLGILWSIAVEEQFYFFFPLALRTAGNFKRFTFALLLFVVLGPFARWLGNTHEPNTFAASFTNSFGSFDLIAMGILLFLFEKRWRAAITERRWLSLAICLSGFAIGTGTYFNTLTGNPSDRIYAPTLLGLGVFLFLLGGLQIKQLQKLPAWLCLPGQLSYGMYLYHPMVLFFLWPVFSGKDRLVGFAIYVASVIALGWLSFRFFEQPMNRLIRKKFIK
jgi:peptidoglycan/LPS O-acetylase OafA/YrhL